MERGNGRKEKVLFVNVGGWRGHQCGALRKRFPELKGRVILQDMKETIEKTPQVDGVECMVQNFWEVQGVKGNFKFAVLGW